MASLNALPTEILRNIIINIPERPFKTELLLLNKTFCSLFMTEQVRNLELYGRRLHSWITVITSNDMETPCSELRYCNFLSKVAKIRLNIDVNGSNFSEETIVGFITRCANLRIFSVQGSHLTTHASLILNHLPSNIVDMHLSACSFGNGDEDIRSLVSYAKRNPKLEALGFSLVTINESTWGELLEPNSTIKQFRLNFCSIGNKGVHALAEALKQNTTLTSLALHNNFYEIGAGDALLNALKQNTTITDLKLHSNYIDLDGPLI